MMTIPQSAPSNPSWRETVRGELLDDDVDVQFVSEDTSTGHFRIMLEQKNKEEAKGTNLHFPLYKQRKMSTCPLSLIFVLLL